MESSAQEAAELATKAEEERQANDAAAEATRGPKSGALPLNLHKKADEDRLHALPFSARMSHSSKEAAARATVGITEAILEEAIARGEELMAHQVPLRLQQRKRHPWVTWYNRWQMLPSSTKQKQPGRLKRTDWPKKQ